MRRMRLPLYLKILFWFFLNLLVLSGVIVLLFQIQFRLNLDWLLYTGARERIDAARDLIVGELNVTPPDGWSQVMERFSDAYHVRFALFDEQVAPLVGQMSEVPLEVRERILFGPNLGRRPVSSPGAAPAVNPSPPFEPGGDGRRRGRGRPQVRALMRTTDPTQYWLVTSARIDNPQAGDPMHVILVANSNSIAGGGLIFNPTPWLWLAFGAVVFSLLFWLPLVRGITRSVSRMKTATRQIADGRFDVRINMRRRDELGALAASIDQMAGRLDGLVKGQKRFLGDIAHELCSPLARLQLALGVIEQRSTAGQEKFIGSAIEKAEQISNLVGELLSFSKASFGASTVQLRPVNVLAAAEEAIRREAGEDAPVRLEIPGHLVVAADSDLLIRALSNLIRNAILHAGQGGPILIRASRNADLVEIRVSDSGPGVPEAELPRIFEPFYRVDTARARETGGTGLGLTIVKACIDSCSGSVTAANIEPHGFEVTIQLSVSREQAR